MFGVKFYHSLIKKYVIAFGTIFNDVVIDRTDDAGNVTESYKVPLTYAAKDKMIYRVANDPALTKQAAVVLPMMSFELKSFEYDADRKKNTLNQIVRKHTDANKMQYVYQSVPYNFNFELNIYVKFNEDGIKIIEQILPYFKPQWDMTLNLVPQLGIKLDTPVRIGRLSSEDKYDGTFVERRALIWTIPFTLEGEFFGPVKTKPIIKFAEQDFYFDESLDPQSKVGSLTVKPGLTANGAPTDTSNNSVDTLTIRVDDNFGFIVESSGLILNE